MLRNSLDYNRIKRFLEFQEEDFPELYQAAKNDSIILFLGAGVSKLYGCCLWFEMAQSVVKRMLELGIINYAECDILYKESIDNPREVMTICYELAKENNGLNDYKSTIEKALMIQDINNCNKVYKMIFSIDSLVYLTTNLDLGIDSFIDSNEKKYNKRRLYDLTIDEHINYIKQAGYNILKDGNVIYLHGRATNIEKSILTVDRYLSHYDQRNSFLNEFFLRIKDVNCLIIFIGYNLDEWDIIEKIYKMENFPKEVKSILLSPIFENNITKFNLEMSYYRSFGVKPVAYIIDENGYRELFSVLKNLAAAINKSIPSPYSIFSEIENYK